MKWWDSNEWLKLEEPLESVLVHFRRLLTVVAILVGSLALDRYNEYVLPEAPIVASGVAIFFAVSGLALMVCVGLVAWGQLCKKWGGGVLGYLCAGVVCFSLVVFYVVGAVHVAWMS